MEQLDLPLDYFEDKISKDKTLPELDLNREKFSHKTLEVLNYILPYKFNYGKYSSYKIELKNNKISKVYFKVGEYRFLIHINYEFLKRNIKQINYTEVDEDEREKNIENIYINLKISTIQQKTKVGYGVFKTSVNYFRYTGIDYSSIKFFLEELLKKYHK